MSHQQPLPTLPAIPVSLVRHCHLLSYIQTSLTPSLRGHQHRYRTLERDRA
jgi:hypothetical protein